MTKAAITAVISTTLLFSVLVNYMLWTGSVIRPAWEIDYVTAMDAKHKGDVK